MDRPDTGWACRPASSSVWSGYGPAVVERLGAIGLTGVPVFAGLVGFAALLNNLRLPTGDWLLLHLVGTLCWSLCAAGLAAVGSWTLFGASGWFLMSRLWLAARGRLPLRLLPFFKYACEVGVLRRAGPVYRFRHARLQDWLAGRELADPAGLDRAGEWPREAPKPPQAPVAGAPAELTAIDQAAPDAARPGATVLDERSPIEAAVAVPADQKVAELVNQGVAEWRDGQAEAAERSWRAVLDDPVARYNLAMLLARRGQRDEAERLWRRTARAGDVAAMRALGALFDQEGRTGEADRWWDRAARTGDRTARYEVSLREAARDDSSWNEQWCYSAGNTSTIRRRLPGWVDTCTDRANLPRRSAGGIGPPARVTPTGQTRPVRRMRWSLDALRLRCLERIEDFHSGPYDVSHVARHQDQSMHLRGRRHQAIDNGKWLGQGVQPAPLLRDGHGHRQDAIPVGRDQPDQPALKGIRLPRVTRADPFDALPDLSDDEHADIRLRPPPTLVPRQHPGIGRDLPQLGDDVGVQQVRHAQPARSISRGMSSLRSISKAASATGSARR